MSHDGPKLIMPVLDAAGNPQEVNVDNSSNSPEPSEAIIKKNEECATPSPVMPQIRPTIDPKELEKKLRWLRNLGRPASALIIEPETRGDDQFTGNVAPAFYVSPAVYQEEPTSDRESSDSGYEVISEPVTPGSVKSLGSQGSVMSDTLESSRMR